jgi:signal transduction histidine kinase
VTATTSVQVEALDGDSTTMRLADLGHELRAPLNSVIGLSAVLGRQLHGPLTDKQAEYVAQIEASGRHLLALVTSILDLAKAESGTLRAEIEELSVAEVVEGSVAVIGGFAGDRDIEVEVDLDPDLPAVLADPLQSRQVLVNLLSNAVKFTPRAGRVGVQARRQGSMVSIQVWDHGIGIPADRLARVFEAFEQIDSSLSRENAGTGLGLTLSRRLAELQGGSLTVGSTPGEGSVFTLVLPAAGAVPERDDAILLTFPGGPRRTIQAANAGGATLGPGRMNAELRGGRPVGGRDLDQRRGVRRHSGAAPGRR